MRNPLFLEPTLPVVTEPDWFNDEEDGMTIKDLEAEAALARLEETYGLNKKVDRPSRKFRKTQDRY